MELAMIGLGRMGGNMVQRLLRGGHRVVVHARRKEAVQAMMDQGVAGAYSLPELATKFATPRAIWLMVPAGDPTESTISAVADVLSPGDVVIDGGNSNYRDSMRRAAALAEKGLIFLDVGTSGGVWGLKEGYCMMVGGERDTFNRLLPIFQTLAPSADKGYGHVGSAGAGHFAKMVHNGIEYGMMEAYAEGFELLNAKTEFGLDLAQIAEIWRYGSVVRSWLLDLAAEALCQDPKLQGIGAYVEDSGEGRWTLEESIELAVPVPVIALSLQARFRSRQEAPFATKMLAALRHQFGGHVMRMRE
jgi:6-phosphogluconate dehydrogenase